MTLSSVITKRFLKRKIATVVLVSASVCDFATLGDDGGKKGRKDNSSVLGARMMGGGFGGCTINLVKEEAIDDLVKTISVDYQKAMNLELSAYIAGIEDGTSLVS